MRTNREVQGLIVVFIVAVLSIVLVQYLLNKYLNIMLISKLKPFIAKWEGGLSRKTSDTASSHPAPWVHDGKTGWHTNKGVTYQTFVGNSKRLGYEASKENFFNMPDELWLKILKEAYVKAYPIEKIAHLPRIQAVIITWAWGSGVSGSESRLARFQREEMGIQDANITPDEIVKNFRNKITPVNELEWFNKLCDRRLADFKKMSTWNENGTGWTRRLTDFRQTFA